MQYMYKLIIVHERSDEDQFKINATNQFDTDNLMASEPTSLDEMRSFLDQAFKAQESNL